jgi:hypothetical protein
MENIKIKNALKRIEKDRSPILTYQLGSLTGREMVELVRMLAPSTNADFEDVFGHPISIHELDTMLEGFAINN